MTDEKPQPLFGTYHLTEADKELTEKRRLLTEPSTDALKDELIAAAEQLGLDTSGTKDELVARIEAHNEQSDFLS